MFASTGLLMASLSPAGMRAQVLGSDVVPQPFVFDSFTGTDGTNLSSHTGEIGAAWSYGSPSANTIQLTGSGRVRGNTHFQVSVILASGVPASPNYTVRATFHYFSSVASYEMGLVARYNGAGGYYYADYDTNANRWLLVSNGVVLIGTVDQTLNAGQDYLVELVCAGTTISLKVDGAVIITGTNSDLPDAGLCGIHCQSDATDTTGVQLAEFTAFDAVSTPIFYADNLAFQYFQFFKSGSGSSSYAQANTGGSYALVNFTGIQALVKFDNSPMAGFADDHYSFVEYQVDGGSWARLQLTSTVDSVFITGLSSGTHRLAMVCTVFGGENQFTATPPESCVRFKSLSVGYGKAISAPSLLAGRGLMYGDSIIGNQAETGEAQYNIPYLCRALMNAEISPVGFPGQGYFPKDYTGGGSGSSLAATWDHFNSSTSRLSGGSYITPPDWIYVEHGENGTPDRADVKAQMEAIRSAFAGPMCINLGAYSGTNKTAITNGFNDYVAAHPSDALVFPIDLGALSYPTTDGTHPTIAGCVIIANALAPALLAVV